MRNAVILFFVIALIPLALATDQLTVARDLPDSVSLNTEFAVTLNVDVDEGNKPDGYILSEKIPEGFVLIESSLDYDSYDQETRVIKWIIIGGWEDTIIEDTAYTYILRAPNAKERCTFNGIIKSDTSAYQTTGDILLTVSDEKCGEQAGDICSPGEICPGSWLSASDSDVCCSKTCIIPCSENWICAEWSVCADGKQTRTCTDQNSCGTDENKPEETQNCTAECGESWTCTTWTPCDNGIQTRTCIDQNDCGTSENKPPLSQSCEDTQSGSSGGSSTGTCLEDWNCTGWSGCEDTKQTRACWDQNNCGTDENKPEDTRNCDEITAIEIVNESTEPIRAGEANQTIIDKTTDSGGETPEDETPTGYLIWTDYPGYVLIIVLLIAGALFYLKSSKKARRDEHKYSYEAGWSGN